MGAAWTGARPSDTTSLRVLIVPAVSTLTGLAVLVAGNLLHLNDLAVGLATATLLAAILRMVLTFGDNARMAAESNREALTDALTGLGNRRRLMRDLETASRHGSSARSPSSTSTASRTTTTSSGIRPATRCSSASRASSSA